MDRQTSRQVQQANAVLRDLDGLFPNLFQTPGGMREVQGTPQKFKWIWAQDGQLMSLIPQYDHEGNFVKDYCCACGVNKNVHDPNCHSLVVSKIRMIRSSVLGPLAEDGRYGKMWYLCRWIPPPPKEEWMETMWTEDDYPTNGRYIPLTRGTSYVRISDAPDEDASRVVVRMLHAHAETWRQDLEEQNERSRMRLTPRYDGKGNVIEEADPRSKFHEVKARIKDAMTVGGHAPGKKDGTEIFSAPSESGNVMITSEKGVENAGS